MLVTRPAGKGPLGRMRAAEQSRTEHVYLAKLWVCRQRLCNGHCSLCLCTSELGCCALVCIPPTFVRLLACGIFCLQMHVALGMLCVPLPTYPHQFVNCVLPELDTASCSQASYFHPPAPEPQILSQPHNIWNVTGQDVIFGCEVFAYPMASIEWRKDGLDIQLPGDDPHISVQVGDREQGHTP